MSKLSINFGYLRGLYDFLFGKTDEELEEFDLNSNENRRALFNQMAASFSKFGPIARKNIVDGINYLLSGSIDDELWRHAIPHDLPLNRVEDRVRYLEEVLFSVAQTTPKYINREDAIVFTEYGPDGLNFFA
jgi:hypothetical protein